eukprot:CAMPEP_0115037312 /NCGR_PEP_ID=MMETSP0216-20121206/42714_1 /TAXON_ID=223996 /ORGANISM="Protocruzia adherens, Strain Boccale" /LENGTH=227 /DNA_ID=CAMNT_0002417449 /DNA_START=231 /DNA_END=915 /DNA_ORIENTATION=+
MSEKAAYRVDADYRARVNEIRSISAEYVTGGDNKEEHEVWGKLYALLDPYHRKYACEEFNEGKLLLEKAGVFRKDRIPSITELSEFLEAQTGFTLRPVVSIMDARQFLNSFAFKVFHCTQYLRHGRSVEFAEEPDLCHEFLGHAPMLVNPDFAEFAHELGMATLGATEEEMRNLTTIFWYTFEFGLCEQNGEKKVFGAGILPSSTEILDSLRDSDRHREFDLKATGF